MTVKVDVRDLLGHPGSTRTISVSESIGGLSVELAGVPEERPVRATLVAESLVEGLLVSGPLSGVLSMSCARCLTDFESPFEVTVRELFVAGAVPGGDEYPVEDGSIDLEPMIRDAVLLSVPFAPVCRPECRGLCSRCGGLLEAGECRCPPEQDPRWAALASLELEMFPPAPPATGGG